MPIGLCGKCGKPTPDSFHDFKNYCNCLTKKEWIALYKKNNWKLKIDGEIYNFIKN